MATALLATVGVRVTSYTILSRIYGSNTTQAISFLVGFFLQDIKLALYIGLGGTALTFLLIVPPWPFFNRHPVKWLPVAGTETKSQGILVDGKVVG